MSYYRLYWGDIHNHNELGYAQVSLERSYDIARSHLDFYAFNPARPARRRPHRAAGALLHLRPV